MPYTVEDYKKEATERFLNSLSPEDRMKGLPPEDRMRGHHRPNFRTDLRTWPFTT